MRPALEYIGGSEYYESQIHVIDDQTERLVYATLAQQQATLALVAATIEQTDAIYTQKCLARVRAAASEAGVRYPGG